MAKIRVHNGEHLLIPLKEAAAMLGMCRQTLMEYVRAGRLPCVRFNTKTVYFRPNDLEFFIDDHLETFNPRYFSSGVELH